MLAVVLLRLALLVSSALFIACVGQVRSAPASGDAGVSDSGAVIVDGGPATWAPWKTTSMRFEVDTWGPWTGYNGYDKTRAQLTEAQLAQLEGLVATRGRTPHVFFGGRNGIVCSHHGCRRNGRDIWGCTQGRDR